MRAHDIPVFEVDRVLRVVKALGAHRYVAARKHWVHALASGANIDPDIDPSSRDERLWSACDEATVARILERFWKDDEAAACAREKLADDLERLELPLPSADPFDESAEDDIHPLLIDCGWELLTLRALDAERHRGLIEYFGDAIVLESARFEEENAIPPMVTLVELCALGPRELLFGAHNGRLVKPLTIWCEGNPIYHEYILKGVFRAAKIE